MVLTTSEKRLKQLVIAMIYTGVAQAFYSEVLVLSKVDHLLIENKRWVGIATGSFIYSLLWNMDS